MDDLAFSFGKMHERFEPEMVKISAYLRLSVPQLTFSTQGIRAILDRIIELADKEIADAAGASTAGTTVKP